MREARVGPLMRQTQRTEPERAGAESRYGLDIAAWAYGKQPYDCHPAVQGGELLKGESIQADFKG